MQLMVFCVVELKEKLISSNWLVYLLCCSDNTLYCGITNNLTRRVDQHNKGRGARYTRGRGPVSVIKTWTFQTKSEALKFEYYVKQLSREEKLKL